MAKKDQGNKVENQQLLHLPTVFSLQKGGLSKWGREADTEGLYTFTKPYNKIEAQLF